MNQWVLIHNTNENQYWVSTGSIREVYDRFMIGSRINCEHSRGEVKSKSVWKIAILVYRGN